MNDCNGVCVCFCLYICVHIYIYIYVHIYIFHVLKLEKKGKREITFFLLG